MSLGESIPIASGIKRGSLISRILAIIAGIITLACCCYWVPFILTIGPSEALAKRLGPPVYPNSKQVGQWQSGGPDSMWEITTYETTDSLEQVIEYFEINMPGFKEVTSSSARSPAYVNGKSDGSLLGVIASFGVNPSMKPSVGVTIYSKPAAPSITIIEVRYDWPAQ